MTQRTCSVLGCDKKTVSRGYCNGHYKRWQAGLPVDVPIRHRSKSPEESFATRTVWNGDCLEWTGATSWGYGVIAVPGGIARTHRWAYEKKFGPVPEGMMIDHLCGNRKCCNTDHLRVVTNKQNMENFTAPSKGSKSGYLGVSRNKKRWRARVMHNGVEHRAGTFDTPEEANEAAIALRNKLFTHNDRDRAG